MSLPTAGDYLRASLSIHAPSISLPNGNCTSLFPPAILTVHVVQGKLHFHL